MLKEFKEFIMRGNVIDMAIGLVMGTAFTAIVNSLVENIIMPLVAAIFGQGGGMEDLAVTVNGATIGYGLFVQSIIDFLMIAIVLFAIIKTINTVRDKFEHQEEESDEAPAPTAEDYLAEIRDLLKEEKAQ